MSGTQKGDMEESMLSTEMINELKLRTNLQDEEMACITESEGWEIVEDFELLNQLSDATQ